MSLAPGFERQLTQKAHDHLESVALMLERSAKTLEDVLMYRVAIPSAALQIVAATLEVVRARVHTAREQLDIVLTPKDAAPRA